MHGDNIQHLTHLSLQFEGYGAALFTFLPPHTTAAAVQL